MSSTAFEDAWDVYIERDGEFVSFGVVVTQRSFKYDAKDVRDVILKNRVIINHKLGDILVTRAAITEKSNVTNN